MTKGISTGINQLVDNKNPIDKQLSQYTKSWREFKNRLDSMLICTNIMKGDIVRKLCQDLDSLDSDGRYKHIEAYWGKQYADTARPLLSQLETIEKEIGLS